MNPISPFFYENLLSGQMIIYLDPKYDFMAMVEVTQFCTSEKELVLTKLRRTISGSHPLNFSIGDDILIHRQFLLDPMAVTS